MLQTLFFEFRAIYLKNPFFKEIDEVAPFFDSKLDEKHDPTIFRIQKTKENKIDILSGQKNRKKPEKPDIRRTVGLGKLKTIRK